jgi:hypothetical protein
MVSENTPPVPTYSAPLNQVADKLERTNLLNQYAAILTSYNPPITVNSSSPCSIPGSNLV